MEWPAWQRINLAEGDRPVLCSPWDWDTSDADFEKVRKAPKARRRATVDSVGWNIYTPVTGAIEMDPVSKENQAASVGGMVVDYDAKYNPEYLEGQLKKLDKSLWPQFVEESLSGNLRLVWVFDRKYSVVDSAHCQQVWEAFSKLIKVDHLHPGLDSASWNPAQRWTNGVTWRPQTDHKHVPSKVLMNLMVEVAGRQKPEDDGSVDLKLIGTEVERRWPGRWEGEFTDGAKGVRFWVETADNPNGCMLRPGGVVCVTGGKAWVPWEEILGKDWVRKHREDKRDEAISNIYFDGQKYWHNEKTRWQELDRQDTILRLTKRGFSNRTGKGEHISAAGIILSTIQEENRVDFALPIVNRPAGIVDYQGLRVLNTTFLKPLEPAEHGDPSMFPFIHSFIWGMFRGQPGLPTEHFLAWLKRAAESFYFRRTRLGQAVFLCGGKDSGKTLLNHRILEPIFGGRAGSPVEYLTGETGFNSDLFDTFWWAIDDAQSPEERGKRALLAKIKDAVVNRQHTYHRKFGAKTRLEWNGRIFVTLNDDPEAVRMLPEVNRNTNDKLMFFRAQPYEGVFPLEDELEATIARELPYFLRWLFGWTPPEEVLVRTRVGVKSYFDPQILEVSRQQHISYNFRELLALWACDVWVDKDDDYTEKTTAAKLLSDLQNTDTVSQLAREFTINRVRHSLTALAREPGSGVSLEGSGSSIFTLHKEDLLK